MENDLPNVSMKEDTKHNETILKDELKTLKSQVSEFFIDNDKLFLKNVCNLKM